MLFPERARDRKMIRSEDRKVVYGWTDCTGGLTEVDGRTAMMKGDRLIPRSYEKRGNALNSLD